MSEHTIKFDLGEPISWTACGLFDSKGLVRVLPEDTMVRAQHEETGRLWDGRLKDLPPRFAVIALLDGGEANG